MQRLRLTVAVAASLAVHVTLGALDVRKHLSPSVPPRNDLQPSYVEFSVQTPESAQNQPDSHLEETARREPPTAHPRSREPHAPAKEIVDPPEPASATNLDLTRVEPTPDAPAREPAPAANLDLSPLAAARSIVDVRAAPGEPLASSRRTTKAEEREGSLDSYLARAALNPALTRADDPALEKKPDGYAFSGNGFDAKIARDGSVRFTDRYGTAGFVLKPEVQPDGNVTFVIFRANFDLTAWTEHLAGNDPYRSERRWFLERTAALRERLALEDFRVRSSRAEAKLKLALRKIWDDLSQGLSRQKQATFALWDECADDEIGARCRRIVKAHIVEQCPLRSGCAFTEQDLAQLNAQRHSRKPFEPYEGGEQLAP